MNLYIYFATRSVSFPSVQPEHREWFASAWHQLLNRNLPKSRIMEIMDPVCESLSQPDVSARQAKNTFQAALQSHPGRALDEWSDFFAFAFVYAGLFQGIYICMVEPLLEGQPLKTEMDVGLPLFISTILLYFICKVLLQVFSAQFRSWKRWVFLAGAFAVYIAGMYLTRFLPAGILVPVWLVVVILGVLAAGMHVYLMRYFELNRV